MRHCLVIFTAIVGVSRAGVIGRSKDVCFGDERHPTVLIRPASLEQTKRVDTRGKLVGGNEYAYVGSKAVENENRVHVVTGRSSKGKPRIFYLQNDPSIGVVLRREVIETFHEDAPFNLGANDDAKNTLADFAGNTEYFQRYPVEEENGSEDISGDVATNLSNEGVKRDEAVPVIIIVKKN